ncbi:MAG: DUF3793 family protein [Oscillospiraceae bacterium]|jgi:hypothetical protein|nr:DUF3793 family protein [Oscillospiraceae bacterium]
MSEKLLVRHCSPTLAGIKTANLFACKFDSEETLRNDLRKLNRFLVPKGVRVLPLRFSNHKALIYLYRPDMLKKDLSNRQACTLLQKHGYHDAHPEQCLAQVACKLKSCSEFPHEIGLFLGYPPEDVQGFIENKAGGCKCVGFWKVYGNEQKAKRLFAKYRKCTAVYCEQWAKGKSIERLTVAV